ncbi:MAG: response regulator [Nitrososphaerota archaeon]|nr:response regulator [Nitrososphaerota archaeon]
MTMWPCDIKVGRKFYYKPIAYYITGASFSHLFIPNKPSILIIDDDTAILRTFMRIFQKKGYNVAVAARGEEAIEKLNLRRFDVALIDFCLPDMEGTKLFSLIEHNSPGTLKIMWSGKIVAQERMSGVDTLLGKPIQPDKLLSIIDSKLKNRNIEL